MHRQRRFQQWDPFLAPQRWLLRLGSRFYYPIMAVAVMAVAGVVMRDALMARDSLRRLTDLMLIGAACMFVLYWRAERMWARGITNWLVRLIRPDRVFLWIGFIITATAMMG